MQIKKRILKITLILLSSIIFLMMGFLILVNSKWFKAKLLIYTSEFVNRELGYKVEIESAEISYFTDLKLNKIKLYDERQKEMIGIESIIVNFDLFSFTEEKIIIDNLHLYSPSVKLIKYAPDGHLNLNQFIIAIQDRFEGGNSNAEPPFFMIKSVILENAYMSYFDERKDSIKDVFDYYHFEFTTINASISEFKFEDNITSFKVNELNLYEPSFQKKVHNLTTQFSFNKRFIELNQLYAEIGKSRIKNYVRFDFENFLAFEDFNKLINNTIELDSAVIFSDDLEMFASTLHNFNEVWVISGNYKGTVEKFSSNDFTIEFGKGSTAKGQMSFEGLPDFYNTFLMIEFQKSEFKAQDLDKYFPRQAAEKLPKFGNIKADGEFIGFPLDFVAYGNFSTSLGFLKSDINLKIKEKSEESYYKGNLITTNFDVGKLTGYENIAGMIDMSGKIEGTGLTLKSAKFNLDAHIRKFQLLDYEYSNITTDARFSKSMFKGELSVKDTNINFITEGVIDFSSEVPVISLTADLKKVNLKEIKLSEEESHIKSKFSANLNGFNIDKIHGNIDIEDIYIDYLDNKLEFNKVGIESKFKDDVRMIKLTSPYLNASLNGKYELSRFQKDMTQLINEIAMSLRNNDTEMKDYYAKKMADTSRYKIDFLAHVKDMNPIFELYKLDIYVAKNTYIEGQFKQGVNTILNINSDVKKFKYSDVIFENTVVELNASKFQKSSEILGFALVESEKQNLYGLQTKNFHNELVWDGNNLKVESIISQFDIDNKLELFAIVDFMQDKTEINLKKFNLDVYDQSWVISDSNLIAILEDETVFRKLTLANKDQEISLSGSLGRNAKTAAVFSVKNFNIEILSEYLPQDIEGIANINVKVQDMYKNESIFGSFTIDSLKVAETYIGNLRGLGQWDFNKEAFNTNLKLIDKKAVVDISGLIYPLRNENQLQLKAQINATPLNFIEPYFSEYASDFQGNFSGILDITNTFTEPHLSGNIKAEKASFKYDYLNVTYYVEDKISFSKSAINFNNIALKDEYGSVAMLNGKINHKKFTDYSSDITLDFKNLLMLNTKPEDNSLYYGEVYGTGKLKITGPFNDVKIVADAYSEKNTKISIPLSGYEGVEEKDFIKFVSSKKTAQKDTIKTNNDLSGINMDFNFEVNQNAYMEIIFDKKAGDIIRGTGNGKLNMVIDTRGDFNIYGTYEIKEGTYNFTLLNLVNKEFTVKPRGTVTWNGDPYHANLNIEAIYIQRASLAPIVLDTLIWQTNPGMKTKKYPANVLLNLKGDLLQPNIALDIDVEKGYPSQLEPFISSFRNEIRNNEQELNKQVFSLIVLKQFAQLNSFGGLNLGASAGRSMSELLSNQLSYWMSQVDDNLEIDLDLGSFNSVDNNSFQLRLSYSFLDGRLLISNQTDYEKSSDLSVVTGEWLVEYLITQDGRLRLKMYNKTSQNSFSNDINSISYSVAGTSVIYTKNFNTISELFERKKDKNKKN